jgi:hypothetical protein
MANAAYVQAVSALGAEPISRCRDAGKKPFGLETGPRLKRAPGPHFGEDQLIWLNQAAWNVERDSNPRQDDYKSSALPLSYPRLMQAPGVRSRTGFFPCSRLSTPAPSFSGTRNRRAARASRDINEPEQEPSEEGARVGMKNGKKKTHDNFE